MKKSRNFNPLDDQAEGYLKLIHHTVEKLIVNKNQKFVKNAKD